MSKILSKFFGISIFPRWSVRARCWVSFKPFELHCFPFFYLFLFSLLFLFHFLAQDYHIFSLLRRYAIGGAFLFQSIELPHESPVRASSLNQVNQYRNKTLDDLWMITSSLNIFDKKAFHDGIEKRVRGFQSRLVAKIRDEGYDGTLSSQWSFSGSFLFSLTVITTIGKKFSIARAD